MRHRVASKQLNRDTKHREALLKNLLRELVEHGAITTTLAKAKVVKPVADKIITTAKEGSIAARRNLHEIFGKRDVVSALVERVAPIFKDRTSGFTRITRVGVRAGDNTQLVQISWVEDTHAVGTLLAPEKKVQPKKEKAAAKPATVTSEKKSKK